MPLMYNQFQIDLRKKYQYQLIYQMMVSENKALLFKKKKFSRSEKIELLAIAILDKN